MARLSSVVVVGEPHHITQRGNNRQNVFQSDADRLRYLELLATAIGDGQRIRRQPAVSASNQLQSDLTADRGGRFLQRR